LFGESKAAEDTVKKLAEKSIGLIVRLLGATAAGKVNGPLRYALR
jgi:hypothetical protein